MKLRAFLITFILSLPFWWGMNLLEKNLKDVFFWQEVNRNPRIFTAQIALEEKLESLKPFKNKNAPELEIQAKSAIAVFLNTRAAAKGEEEDLFSSTTEGNEKILFEKETDTKLPMASLTKLMTAYLVLENYNLSKEIKITKEAISQEGDFGQLEVGAVYPVEYLLYPLLMESSNDAAYALVNDYEEGGMNREKFVELMNLTAQNMGLENTYFFNPTGLEPEEDKYTKDLNYSTVQDLVKLTKQLLKKPLIWQILSTPTYSFYGPELKNTNELLFDDSIDWRTRIIGGKTGYTEKAGGCIILVLAAPKNKGYLINVILATPDNNERFNQMKKLVDWLNLAYKW